jgi:recombination protein RecT
MECDPISFIGSIMFCAQLGLEPGGPLGHVYLVPYGKSVTPILGYKGMIELARRSGQIVSISAHEVYEKDHFDFEYGLDEKLCHKPNMKGDRGAFIGAYAIAHIVGGGHQIEVMSKKDIDNIKNRSKANNGGPWVTDYPEMSKKTVIRKLFKYLPVSVEIQRAVATDEMSELGNFAAASLVDDANNDPYTFDSDTGEIIEEKSSSDKLMEKLT